MKDIEIDGNSLTKHSKTFTGPQLSQSKSHFSKSWFARVLIIILASTGLVTYSYLQTRNGILESKLDQITSDIRNLSQKIDDLKSGLDKYESPKISESGTKPNSTRLSKSTISSESISASYVLVTGKAS